MNQHNPHNRWWKWPAKRNNNHLPWYWIVWKAPFLALGLTFIFLAAVSAMVAHWDRQAFKDVMAIGK